MEESSGLVGFLAKTVMDRGGEDLSTTTTGEIPLYFLPRKKNKKKSPPTMLSRGEAA